MIEIVIKTSTGEELTIKVSDGKIGTNVPSIQEFVYQDQTWRSVQDEAVPKPPKMGVKSLKRNKKGRFVKNG